MNEQNRNRFIDTNYRLVVAIGKGGRRRSEIGEGEKLVKYLVSRYG